MIELELRPVKEMGYPWGPWAVYLKGGPQLPDQMDVTIYNEPNEVRRVVVTFMALPFAHDEPAEPTQDLPAASAAFAALSFENRKRFVHMYWEELAAVYAAIPQVVE